MKKSVLGKREVQRHDKRFLFIVVNIVVYALNILMSLKILRPHLKNANLEIIAISRTPKEVRHKLSNRLWIK